jgi:hypothetical protein
MSASRRQDERKIRLTDDAVMSNRGTDPILARIEEISPSSSVDFTSSSLIINLSLSILHFKNSIRTRARAKNKPKVDDLGRERKAKAIKNNNAAVEAS